MLRDKTLARESKLFKVFVRSLEHRCTIISIEYFFGVIKQHFFTFVSVMWNFNLMWLASEWKLFCVERDQTSLPSPFPRREIRLWVWEGQFQWRVQWPGEIACRLLRVSRSRTGEEEEEWGGAYLKVTWPLFREQKRCNDADVNSTQLMSGGVALFTFTDPRWIASRLRSFLEQLMSQMI